MTRQTTHDEEDARQFAQKIELLLIEMGRRWGKLVKSHWFYDAESCPGCGFPIDSIDHEKGPQVSINAFIYRPEGVLIGYFLCSICAGRIFEAAQEHPYVQTPLHGVIEQNLTRAYLRFRPHFPPPGKKRLMN
jgi:hypothetical protein